jgi:hypothetical protein
MKTKIAKKVVETVIPKVKTVIPKVQKAYAKATEDNSK